VSEPLDVVRFSRALKAGGFRQEETERYLRAIAESNGSVPNLDLALNDMMEVYTGPRERNLAHEIARWIAEYPGGWFTTAELDRELGIGQTDRTNRRVTLHRLAKDGIIEPQKGKSGVYRRVESAVDPIEWKEAEFNEIELRWPFGLEEWEKTYERTVDVIAGSSGAGKTAFIFNFIRMNQHNHLIRLMSSEMGPQQLKIRLSKFGLPVEEWAFDAISRNSNFADAILPDDINVIDYLETDGDAVYRVGNELRDIFNRLNKGMALVAIQKKMNRTRTYKGQVYHDTYDLGRGAEFSMEKARLYLSIDYHHLKIVKATNWRYEDINPKGMQWSFKLVRGCEFVDVQQITEEDEQ